MTATAEEMSKFMEMFAKAMGNMAEKEKSKSRAKIFDRDFVKEAKEFDGAKEGYHLWQFKWRLGMKSNARWRRRLSYGRVVCRTI